LNLQLEMLREWIPTYTCPSRRSPGNHPVVAKGNWTNPWFVNAAQLTNFDEAYYRSDYSVNGGTQSQLPNPNTVPDPFIELYLSGPNAPAGYGPASLGDALALLNTSTPQQQFKLTNGIAHQFSEITPQDIFDGASNTYLVGEKYLNSAHYISGADTRDDHPAYGADVRDLFSFGDAPPRRDEMDLNASESPLIFGSAHDIFHVVKCDGSIAETSYDIDLAVHAELSNRRDSRP
jgi:hypothetical protein